MSSKPWSDQDIQRVRDVYTDLWPQRPAEEEFADFLSLVQGKVHVSLVDAAIRRVKHRQTTSNFRPSTGVFMGELSSEFPQRSTEVTPTPEEMRDPRELLQETLASEDPSTQWLRDLIVTKRWEEGVREGVGEGVRGS